MCLITSTCQDELLVSFIAAKPRFEAVEYPLFRQSAVVGRFALRDLNSIGLKR
jgi:hypothetical protein